MREVDGIFVLCNAWRALSEEEDQSSKKSSTSRKEKILLEILLLLLDPDEELISELKRTASLGQSKDDVTSFVDALMRITQTNCTISEKSESAGYVGSDVSADDDIACTAVQDRISLKIFDTQRDIFLTCRTRILKLFQGDVAALVRPRSTMSLLSFMR